MNLIFFILHRAYLIFFLWYKHFLRIAASSVALLITLILVVLFLGVMRPVKDIFARKLTSSLPGELIKLKPKELAKYSSPLALFSERPDIPFGLSKKQLNQLKSWKGVEKVYATQMMQRPALTYLKHPMLSSLGGGLRFDVLMQGVEYDMVKPYLFCMKNFQPKIIKVPLKTKETKRVGRLVKKENRLVIPVVIPEVYVSIAQAWLSVNRLPMIQMSALNGLDLEIQIGQSLLQRSQPSELKVTGKICGFIPEGIVTAIGVPLTWVKRYHKREGMKQASSSYDQIFVKIKNSKDTSKIKKRAKKFGLISYNQSKKYGELFKWIEKIDYIFWSVALILLLFSGISLVNSFTLLSTEKKYEFGLYLVLGSSPLFIWVMMFIEGAIWGMIHAFLSLSIAEFIFNYLKENIQFMQIHPELASLSFTLSGSEKTTLFLASVLFTGLSSLVPSMLLMKNKIINMVKKD